MTENTNQSNSFGEEYFSNLSDAPFNDPKYKEEYDLIMSLLGPKSGDKVLDMGCGKGQLGLFLKDKVKDADVTFSDVSKIPNEYLKGHSFVQCSMTKTPFPDNSFDKIYSLSTISHIDDIDSAIKEMLRISKGEILITTNNKWCVEVYKAASFFGLIPKFQYDKTVKRLFSSITLRRLLSKNGWKVRALVHYGKYPSNKLKLNFLKTRLMIVASK